MKRTSRIRWGFYNRLYQRSCIYSERAPITYESLENLVPAVIAARDRPESMS